MKAISVDVSIEQIKKAMRQLPAQEKIALWRLLDDEIDRPAIARRFAKSIKDIRKAYAHLNEDEVMEDAIKATHQVRRSRHARSRS